MWLLLLVLLPPLCETDDEAEEAEPWLFLRLRVCMGSGDAWNERLVVVVGDLLSILTVSVSSSAGMTPRPWLCSARTCAA